MTLHEAVDVPVTSALLSGVADSVGMETRLLQGGGERAAVDSIRDITDGVFSFTMTVVFASIGFPLLSQDTAGATMASGLLLGVLVFWMVAMVWQHHSIVLQQLECVDFRLRRDNLRVLGVVCVMPYAFGWSVLSGGTLGYVVYLVVYAVIYHLQHRLWLGALARGLVRDGIDARYLQDATEWSRFRAFGMAGVAGVSVAAALVLGMVGTSVVGSLAFSAFTVATWARMRHVGAAPGRAAR